MWKDARSRRWLSLIGLLTAIGAQGCVPEPCGSSGTAATCATPTPTGPSAPVGAQRLLPVIPIAQQTQVWCWAASAEMVFRYYGLPNVNRSGDYQCGIVGAYGVMIAGAGSLCDRNCYACISGISTLFELQRLVIQYGRLANLAGFSSPVLDAQPRTSALSFEELTVEIDANRPVIAGVSFNGINLPGISQHAVVIVGYDATTITPAVFVNDPFPYDQMLQFNPYIGVGGRRVRPGQYQLTYSAFRNQINWGNTLWRIQRVSSIAGKYSSRTADEQTLRIPGAV